ncbi:MAG: hypothetical protein FJ088_12490, partial [Deltaproteobacteria bacterium]|nr:hypothetical protein [Deltaproteobacteria bacterium]
MKWPRIWLVAHPDRKDDGKGTRRGVDMPESLLSSLAAELEEFAPDVILTNNRPSEVLRARLLQCAPRAKIIDLTEKKPLVDETGRRQYRDILIHQPNVDKTIRLIAGEEMPEAVLKPDCLLLHAVSPCYERKFLQKECENLPEQPLRLALDMYCPYETPVRKNRFFKDLDSPWVLHHKGCSFCRWHISDINKSRGRRTVKSQINLALRQIE